MIAEGGPRLPQPGDVLAGKYSLKRVLGEGGMGIVMEAEHLRLRQPIAIKFLNPCLLGDAETVERFGREARAAATLRGRHVVRVTDVEQTPAGIPYIVMELLEGTDLESERERRGRLPYAEAVDYVLQACSALAGAHDAGIVHRDLKPANLFLAKEEERRIVKVLDFGISRFLEEEEARLTTAGAVMGTVLYMSPEQVRGETGVDARSDIWSLGLILYELTSGRGPWVGPAPRIAAGIVTEPAPDLRTLCEVPDGLARAVHACLEKEPTARPAGVTDVAAALAPFVGEGTVGAEVARQLARRSQKNLAAPDSSRSQRAAAPVSSAMVPVALAATQLATRPRARPWAFLAVFAVLALAFGLFIAVAMRPKVPVSAHPSADPAPSASAKLPASTGSAVFAQPAPGIEPSVTGAPAVAPTVSLRRPVPSVRVPRRPLPSATVTTTATATENPAFLN